MFQVVISLQALHLHYLHTQYFCAGNSFCFHCVPISMFLPCIVFSCKVLAWSPQRYCPHMLSWALLSLLQSPTSAQSAGTMPPVQLLQTIWEIQWRRVHGDVLSLPPLAVFQWEWPVKKVDHAAKQTCLYFTAVWKWAPTMTEIKTPNQFHFPTGHKWGYHENRHHITLFLHRFFFYLFNAPDGIPELQCR